MKLLILYLGITFVGYFVGSRLRHSEKNLSWTGKVQFVCIMILVYMMGSRIGANEEVVASLGTIGLTAFILTIFIFIGSVGMVFLARKLMKIDKKGVKIDD